MKHLALCAAILLLVTSSARAQIKAFPQAEGYGATARGGRGGDVYHVTNLNNSGAGSLRNGIETAPASGRTIVFDVGGWINLTAKLGVDTNIRNLTIAGQTAPGGIGIRGAQFSVGGDDIIVRHMRFRPGKAAGSDNDSINTNDNAERVIYDHISAEFSTDGGFDNQATDVTLQFSSVSFGLQTHSTGALLENPTRLSFHHNLFAHNNTRNPKHRVYGLDWVNNVVYNWNTRAIELQGTSDPAYQWTANIDGNYFIAGPDHDGVKPLSGGSTQNYETWWGTNAYDADRDSDHDGTDYSFGGRTFADVTSALTRWRTTPFPVTDEIWKDANTNAAYQRVLAEFGATPWDRDEVNTYLHGTVVSRNGSIITRESDLPGISNGGFGTLGGVAAPLDTDQDGIPDSWEVKHGLSPTSASNNGDFDDDGYTNLEEYLNDIAAFEATGALEFQTSFGRYADWNNWTRRWEPSRLDDVHFNSGEAVVDAVGQKAGNVRLGAAAGSFGTLGIESGWLEVTDEIVIGAHESGGGELSLSGGALRARKLSKGAGGEFNFTGGTLSVDEVDFSLTNGGGTISPGTSPGAMHVDGDLTLQGGTLLVEIGGTDAGQFDCVEATGVTTLGGLLQIVSVDFGEGVYVPQLGDQLPILTSEGGFAGEFSQIRFPTIDPALKWQLVEAPDTLYLSVTSAAGLAGDYNDDGVVDAADYTVWRDAMNSGGPLENETASPGVVDEADYLAWRTNFGMSGGSGVGSAVPEPAAIALVFLAVLGAAACRRR